jgi:hypothetical protein
VYSTFISNIERSQAAPNSSSKQNSEKAATDRTARPSRSQSNLGFQSAIGRTRRGEPDRSCRLPSLPAGRTRPVASLLIRDQAGCPFDETGRMPVLRARNSSRRERVQRKTAMFSLPKAMRRRIALRKHFVRNASKDSSRFAQLWECVRVLAPLFDHQATPWRFH